MTSEARVIDVPGVPRFEVAPHNCFACGTLNVHGLGLVLHVGSRRAWTETVLRPEFEGWEGIAHGGVLCTVLDEVMAWALVAEDNWGLTARMSVDFKRPARIGVAIRAEGWTTRSGRRLSGTAGHIVESGSGMVIARATGLYMAADEPRKQELRRRYGFAAPGSDRP